MKKVAGKRYGIPAVLVALMLIAGGFAWAQKADDFVGTWNGNLSIATQELEIICHFELDEEGGLKGTVDVVAQGANGIPLGEFVLDGKNISFIIDHPNVPGDPRFEGALDETGKKIAGKFTQSGYEGTFSLEKE